MPEQVLESIDRIHNVISRDADLKVIQATILYEFLHICGANRGAIGQFEHQFGKDTAYIRYRININEKSCDAIDEEVERRIIPEGNGSTAFLIENPTEYAYVNDKRNPNPKYFYNEEEDRFVNMWGEEDGCELLICLRYNDSILLFLCADDSTANAFGEDSSERDVVNPLLERVKIFKTLVAPVYHTALRKHNMSKLLEYSAKLNRQIDFDKLNTEIIKACYDMLDYNYLYILDTIQDRQICGNIYEYNDVSPPFKKNDVFSTTTGIIRDVMKGNIFFENVTDLSDPAIPPDIGDGALSVLFVPMTVDKQVLGMLGLLRTNDVPFNEDEKYILENVANQAAISLKVSQGFAELEQLKDVFKIIGTITPEVKDKHLHLWEHIVIKAITFTDAEGGSYIKCVDGQLKRLYDYDGLKFAPGPLVQSVYETKQFATERKLSASRPELYREYANSEGLQIESIIAVPILYEDECVGVVMLHSNKREHFTIENGYMLSSLISMATPIIDFIKYYNEALKIEAHKRSNDLLHFIIHGFKTQLGVIQKQVLAGKLDDMNQYVDDQIDQLSKLTNITTEIATKKYRGLPLEALYEFFEEKAQTLADIELDYSQINKKIEDMGILNQTVFFEILDNLVKNAHEAIDIAKPPQGRIEVGTVDHPDEEMVEIWIEDNGTGFTEEDLNELFHKPYRGEQKKDNLIYGWGFALTFIYDYINTLGGKITANNREDMTGAIFNIWIPYYRTVKNKE